MSEVETTGDLARETNWWGAFVIGLAGTILVIGLVGYAIVAMGGLAIVLFAILTGCGVLLCFCLAELAAAYPERTGGVPSFAFETYRSLGPNVAKHIGGLSSWAYWLGWFTVAPINAILAANYIVSLVGLPTDSTVDMFGSFGPPVTWSAIIVGAIILIGMFIPCYLGIRLGASFATVLGVASIIPLVLLVLLPFFKPSTIDFGNLNGFQMDPAAAYAGTEATLPFLLGWAFIFTWSVLAMEAAACYIGECKNPARDAKIAMTAEGIFGYFVYLAVPIMLIAVLGAAGLSALGTEEAPFFGDANTLFIGYTTAIFGESEFWKWFVGLTLIIALILSVLNAIMGCARGLYQNAHDGILPRWFGHSNKHGTPDYSMIFNLVCSLVLLFVGSPLEIYIFSNMGYLFACAMAMVGYGIWRREGYGHVKRPVKMPGWVPPLALFVGVILMGDWLVGGFYASDYAVGAGRRELFLIGLLLLLLYIPLYYWRRLEDRRLGRTSFASRASGG